MARFFPLFLAYVAQETAEKLNLEPQKPSIKNYRRDEPASGIVSYHGQADRCSVQS